MDIVKEGAGEAVELLTEYNKINDLFGLPEYYEDAEKMQKLMDKQAKIQDKIDAIDAWSLENTLERAMDALRCPEGETPISVLSEEKEDELPYVDYYCKSQMFFY